MSSKLRSLFLRASGAVLLFGSASWSSGQPLAPTYDELVYATVDSGSGDRELVLDLYLPNGDAAAAGEDSPLVLWIHGGGWRGGSHNAPPRGLRQLLQRGFAVASVEYRLSGEAIAPAQIHDVKGAVRFLRANADDYHLDADRFAAWGSSAGGHLSAMLATTGGVAEAEGDVGGNLGYSSAIQAAVDYFGPADLLTLNQDFRDPVVSVFDHDAPNSPESLLIGFDGPGEGIGVLRDNLDNPAAPFPEKAALVELMSPIKHASPDDAPMFIAHGDLDASVPFLQSVHLNQELRRMGVETVFRRVEGAGHGGPLFAEVDQQAVRFLSARFGMVPEPSTAVLMALAGVALASRQAAEREPRRGAGR